MDKQALLNEILAMHEAYYDVTHAYTFASLHFDGYAEYHSESSQYVLAKRAKLWGANTHDYLFFKLEDKLTAEQASALIEFMKTQALEKVELNPEHMTSYLSLVILTGEVEEAACEIIRKAKYRKDFKFGLQGWADLRLALADLSSSRIIANKQGAELADTLQQCLGRDGMQHS